MLNAKQVLKLSGNKNVNAVILNCYNVIIEAAKYHETQCIVKPDSVEQANFISGYFKGEGFNVSIIQGINLCYDNRIEGYLLISWKNPKIEKPAKTTTTVEEAVSKVVEESANDIKSVIDINITEESKEE